MQRSPWSAAEEAAALRHKRDRYRSAKSSAGGNGRGHSDDDDEEDEDDESGDDGLGEADGEHSGDSGEARHSWREFAAVVNSAHHVASTLHEWNQVWSLLLCFRQSDIFITVGRLGSASFKHTMFSFEFVFLCVWNLWCW
jgi:hypothetical protein